MSKFRIFETDEFIKTLGKLPQKDKKFIQKKLKAYIYPQLRNEPFRGRNIKKLKDYHPPNWRYRVGNYRLFYYIDKTAKIVNMLTIDNRKDAYK